MYSEMVSAEYIHMAIGEASQHSCVVHRNISTMEMSREKSRYAYVIVKLADRYAVGVESFQTGYFQM